MVQDARARMTPSTAGALVERSFAPLGPARPDESMLDLVGLIEILRRKFALIAITTVIVVAIAAAYAFLATPLYTATSKILIDAREKNTLGTEVVPSGLGTKLSDNFALVDSQVKIIMSDAVLAPVVRSQHLDTDPEFGARKPGLLASVVSSITGLFKPSGTATANDDPNERALLILAKQLEVSRDDQTYVIDISVSSIDPLKAARLAQAVAEAYLTDQSDEKVSTSEQVSSLMDGQLAALRDRLLKAENDVQQFRAEHGLQEAGGDLLDTRQLEALNEQLASAKSDVTQKQAKHQEVHLLLDNDIEPEMIGEAVGSDTVSRLREQYAIAARREAILGAELLPSHPQLKQARSEVERLRGLIRAEVERIAKAVDLDYAMAKRRLAAAETALAASREHANTNDSARIKLRELVREADSTRWVYENFLTRVKEIDEAQEIYTADARIISPASIPEDPSWPKKRLILALALVFGCGLGGSLALATEHLNRCIHTGTELRGATGLKSLVTIPALSGGRGRVAGLLGSSPKRASFYDVVVEVLEAARARPLEPRCSDCSLMSWTSTRSDSRVPCFLPPRSREKERARLPWAWPWPRRPRACAHC